MRVRLPIAPCVLLLWAQVMGCGDDDLTEIMVVVDTDMRVGVDIDRVRIDVTGLGAEPQVANAVLAGSGAVSLPVTVGLVHRGGSLGPIEVTASGLLGTETRISRRARVSFQPGKTVVLRMDLLAACVGMTCGAEQTCAPGGCRTVNVAAAELGAWPEGAGRIDASTPLVDAGPMDAGPMDAGPPDAGPPRVTTGLVVLYTFEEGSGTVVRDVSGVAPPLDLTIDDPSAVTWLPGALSINASTIAASSAPATKIIDACVASNELSLEAWVEPADLVQSGPARMITLSANTSYRNFTLGQDADQWVLRVRTTTGDTNGGPNLYDGPGTVTTSLVHVVSVRTAGGIAAMYVNGVETGTLARDGDFSGWDPTFRFAVANELTMDRTWLGRMHLVAVYCRALTAAEVRQNFAAGPSGP